jgi:phospholipase/carboxylesterase
MSTDPHSVDPHRDQPILTRGAALKDALGAVVLLHGRGGSADNILGMTEGMLHPGLAYLAPAAAQNTWYPLSFLAPKEQNEPWLTSALKKVEATLQIIRDSGIPNEKILICGFSQGACLSSEFVARNPTRYAGLIAFTGGLIGPPGMDLTYPGDLAGTPAFFGSGDPDPHVPWSRVQESIDVYTRMGAKVASKRYPGKAHDVSQDEIDHGNKVIAEAFGPA